MTYSRLKDWAGAEDPDDLALFMSNEIRQIEDFLTKDSIREDWYSLFVSSVDCMIKAQLQRSAVSTVLDMLCKTPFLDKHLTAFVLDKMSQQEWDDGHSFLDAMIRIFESVLKVLPAHSLKIITAIPQLKNIGDVYKLDDMASKIENMRTRASQIYKVGKEQPQSRHGLTSSGEDPPDHYLELSVLPTCNDIKDNKNVFVRPAVLEGSYKDKDHYLDVQFRLMKQDFVIPLRQGIVEFQKNGKKKHFSSSDLRMYHGVHILGMVTQDGIDHVLQFDNSKLKKVRWDFSKRLIFGSLVCLSKDGFETIAIATISNRDPKDLKRGQVNVNIKSGLDIICNSTPNDEFVMAETVAFYESYCHVLEGLQGMDENLPLQEYIVSCEKKVRPPQYLLGGTSSPLYDLSPFMTHTTHIDVPVLLTTKWPSSDKMCLNQSQREAAQTALTKRLAVIQGPPGTGKTYVGLKVVQTILANQANDTVMDTTNTLVTKKDTPILIVCYTNHALDQFLEGILQFCDGGIIRVGGRSKSECLDQYNLKTIRKKMKNAGQLSCISVEKSRKHCFWKLKTLTEEIQATSRQMEHIDCGTCGQEKLLSYNVMSKDHTESLLNYKQDNFTYKGSALGHWLNARTEDPGESVAKIIESNMTRLIIAGNFSPTHCELSEKMPIEARATQYLKIVSTLKTEFHNQISDLQPLAYAKDVREKIGQNLHIIGICEREILPDNLIRLGLNTKKFTKIKQFLGRKETSFPNAVYKAWLLGLHKEQHEQLNDLERLQTKGSELNSEQELDIEMDDVRRVEADLEDDFDKEYLAKTRALRNSFRSIMQRLEELGLDDEEDQFRSGDVVWQQVAKPLNYTKMRKKIKATKPMTNVQEQKVTNIWDLSMKERYALYRLWLDRCKSVLSDKMTSLVEQYEQILAQKNEIIGQETVSILRKAKIIGMTTTGAARYRSVLQAVGCKIIVVEEAAEVLEAHIVTALNKNCEHLILIGDHQQLRPSPVVYELATKYGLEISLFERLVKNGFPHVVLQEQHRMRPEIAQIMRHIYPHLRDHPDVSSYDHVRGVSKSIFLVQHEESESSVEDTKSRANDFEASYATKLCSYLLLQGYETSKITILATYAGQVLAIKTCMKTLKCPSDISRVQVTSVDNFQGEENDIIILSLVRSNEEKNIGFLKVDNRVCVALSRAKKGLFILGNFELLASQSKLWSKILDTARIEGIVGDGLPVVCCSHPDEEAIMFRAEHFDSRPLGGCGLPCGYRLTCGHLCEQTCHGYDQLHESYRCQKPCTKSCSLGHPCQKKCFEDCGKCYIKVPKMIPRCGHEDLIPCYLPPKDAVCSQRCEKIFDECEHQCSGQCGHCFKESKHAPCEKRVQYLWPCGHKATVKCYQKPSNYPCPHPCETILNCGHKCKGTCSECLQGKVHIACDELCKKELPCGHPCSNYCSAPCQPCSQPCPSKCRHRSCGKSAQDHKGTCGHICIPCKEECIRHCKCQNCSKLCFEKCSKFPCNKRCSKRLKCSHRCSGICGELCVCGTCYEIITLSKSSGVESEKNCVRGTTTDEQMTDDQFSTHNMGFADESKTGTGHKEGDSVMCKEADCERENSKDDKSSHQHLLLKVPSCDHVFYVKELDQYVNNFEPQGSSFIPCPKCQRPIQNCSRYEHINQTRREKRDKLKKALLKENEILAPDKVALIKSKKILEASFELMDDLKKIDPYNMQYKSEILAVSLKFKLAYVLNELESLKPYIDEDSEFSQILSTRKAAVLGIRKHFTPQQKHEFISDLACSLCRAVVIKVKDISSNHSVPASLIDLIENRGSSVHAGGLGRFLELIEANIKTFLDLKKNSLASSNALSSALQCDVITKHVSSAFQVLQSDDSKVGQVF